ncbi:alpha/beta fold hydrolase [Mycobacterium sp. NPDC003449]
MTAQHIVLESVGSFYAGGQRITITGEPHQHVRLTGDLPAYAHDPNGTYAIDHAYVNYLIPARSTKPPVVFVHGGGLTGAMWESTPDGRPGWVTSFLTAGHPCYVVDNVERGRAGWCSLPGQWEGQPILRNEQQSWDVFRIGRMSDYAERRAFPGSQFPVSALEEVTRQSVPRWTSSNGRAVASLTAAVERIGRCVLVGHSHGGGISAHVAMMNPGLVAAAVLLEPHGLPDISEGAAPGPQVIIQGDFIEESALYEDLQAVWSKYVVAAAQHGVRAETLVLPELGHTGNSHNMMMDLNSDDVAETVQSWISQNVAS